MAGDKDNAGGGTPVTMEQVQKLIADSLTAALEPVTQSIGKLAGGLQQQSRAADAVGVRRRYMEEKMKDVPAIYAERMPETSDAGQLAQAEQAVRNLYKDDLKLAGVKAAPIGGTPENAIPIRSLMNVGGKDTRTPSELITEGLAKAGPPPQAPITQGG